MLDRAEKRLKTTFIGDLAEFERGFGFLWGHGMPPQDLNEDERYFRDLWNEVRKNILDKGNRQIADLRGEAQFFTIESRKFQYNFPVKPRRRPGQLSDSDEEDLSCRS